MTAADDRYPLPDFVQWSGFPFEGDLQVRSLKPFRDHDRPRQGEPGGPPCTPCGRADDTYIWADDNWRVSLMTSGLPIQVMLESRRHLDLDGLDEDLAADYGRMTVRLTKAMHAVGGIGRVHFSRWGDGAEHFHVWFYGRPLGASQMLGFCLPMWAMIVPPITDEVARANALIVATDLARTSGQVML